MGKNDKKSTEVAGEKYNAWKSQQLAAAQEREAAKKDKFKFWKNKPATVTTAPGQTTTTNTTTNKLPEQSITMNKTSSTVPTPPSAIVPPSPHEANAEKKGLDKLKFWKKEEKPDTTVMIKDFRMQHNPPPPRKPIVFKMPLRERIGDKFRHVMPRTNARGFKLCTIFTIILIILLLIVLVPIGLKIAKFAI